MDLWKFTFQFEKMLLFTQNFNQNVFHKLLTLYFVDARRSVRHERLMYGQFLLYFHSVLRDVFRTLLNNYDGA